MIHSSSCSRSPVSAQFQKHSSSAEDPPHQSDSTKSNSTVGRPSTGESPGSSSFSPSLFNFLTKALLGFDALD